MIQKQRIRIMTDEQKKIFYRRNLIAYAYFSSIGEEHIVRYTRCDEKGVHWRMEVELRMIGHVLECVHRLTDLGETSNALLALLVEVDFYSWQLLVEKYPNCFTKEEILLHVLRAYFQKEDWHLLCHTSKPLLAVSNKMMSLFSLLGLMDWCHVVDLSLGMPSRLDILSSFRDAVFVFLNVHADNFGFEAEEDQKDLRVLMTLVDEIMKEK